MDSTKKYVVQTLYDEEPAALELLSDYEIVSRESMRDCSGADMCIWEPGKFGELIKLKLHGTWHNDNDHLYIKATRPDGSTIKTKKEEKMTTMILLLTTVIGLLVGHASRKKMAEMLTAISVPRALTVITFLIVISDTVVFPYWGRSASNTIFASAFAGAMLAMAIAGFEYVQEKAYDGYTKYAETVLEKLFALAVIYSVMRLRGIVISGIISIDMIILLVILNVICLPANMAVRKRTTY